MVADDALKTTKIGLKVLLAVGVSDMALKQIEIVKRTIDFDVTKWLPVY